MDVRVEIKPNALEDDITVSYRDQKVSVYRGADLTDPEINAKLFKLKSGECKVDSNGFVKSSHGVSLDVNPEYLQKFGGAIKLRSLPQGLKIIQRGKRPEHFEIVPEIEFLKLLTCII